jgi:hypothetical protein
MTTTTLRTWSHILFWLTIAIPILGALLTAGAAIGRYYVDRRISGPWLLSSRQQEAFRGSLKDAPKGKVAIEYIRSDEARSRDYAVKIRDILKDSGYDVWGYMPAFEQGDASPIVGVQIIVKNQQSDIVGGGLQKAFRAIGIDAKGARRTDNNYEDDFVVIWIGMKP